MIGRRIEIAGAGLAGLTAGAALAQRGFRVRIHERRTSLREEGFGITVYQNGLRVLHAIGALEAAVRDANPVRVFENRNSDGLITALKRIPDGAAYRIARYQVVEAMASAAQRAGAEIKLGSTVTGATPDGEIRFADGERARADVIIAADGINSVLRDGLGLMHKRRLLPDGAQRLMISRRAGDIAADKVHHLQEWWSGGRRLLYCACSPTEIYIAMSCRADDSAARAIPIDASAWRTSFPPMASVIDRISAEADWAHVYWQQFQAITLRRWSAGVIAVVGDAAHGMPPNLGQGGGCAMMNALGLAVALGEAADVPAALARWEARERPLTEHTQRWSLLYGRLTTWPPPLRRATLRILADSRWLRAQFQRTANHAPTGTLPLPNVSS